MVPGTLDKYLLNEKQILGAGNEQKTQSRSSVQE